MTQRVQFGSLVLLLVGGLLAIFFSLQAPADFPAGTTFQVGEGESLKSLSMRLEEGHFVTSALFFRAWVSVLGKDKSIGLGTYKFEKKLPMGLVIAKFARGPDDPLLTVTIPEGYSSEEIAQAFKKAMPSLDTSAFLRRVSDEKVNGYLFPATYYPLPSYTEEDIIAKMKSTFDREYSKAFLHTDFPRYVPTQHAIITLASILEGEAKTPEDMKMVAGILENRLAKGMRLQVDVAPITYKKTGLPDEPLNNPGIVAMDAVFHPVESEYVYYLTGKDGTMHYAKTYAEHQKNIQKYLR
jgi:UPF0755 protein